MRRLTGLDFRQDRRLAPKQQPPPTGGKIRQRIGKESDGWIWRWGRNALVHSL
jgi:hypothetical protein